MLRNWTIVQRFWKRSSFTSSCAYCSTVSAPYKWYKFVSIESNENVTWKFSSRSRQISHESGLSIWFAPNSKMNENAKKSVAGGASSIYFSRTTIEIPSVRHGGHWLHVIINHQECDERASETSSSYLCSIDEVLIALLNSYSYLA